LNETDLLLNAVLADEGWQALSSSLKREALAALGAERRKRHVQFRMGQAACVAMLIVGLAWWVRPLTQRPHSMAQSAGPPASPGTGNQFVSEEQMLAMFPRGSCVVAE